MKNTDRTGRKVFDVTCEECKLIRKALQCVEMAHTVTETADGIQDRETKIDGLIRKFRAAEEGLTENEKCVMIVASDYE